MKLIKMIENDMQSVHGSKSIHCAHKCIVNMINATTVQNDVIERRFINSMNMVMDAQYEYVIMQLMVGNMIMMYKYTVKKDHNKFAEKVHKLIYHGGHGNTRCNKAIIM